MISKDSEAKETLVKGTDPSIPHRPKDKDTQKGDNMMLIDPTNMMLIDPTLSNNDCLGETMGITATQNPSDHENLADTNLIDIPLKFVGRDQTQAYFSPRSATEI
ncbi:UNVERIFIED_CONTAM: hypothetical protein Sradi_0480500 [Sesamum radiatum]|uniref:Uncharacterized protein n=1 Tax=Sesamum radiatum TaxID=300843 RepID=A0AAW2WCE7_SESRA